MDTQTKNIVILGGGFAGLRAALEFERRAGALRDHHVILIDREQHHLYTPLLYEVASAFLYAVPVKERYCMHMGVCVDFTAAGLERQLKRTHVVHGTVVGLNVEKRLVAVEDHPPLPYEYCIVALGSVVDDFGIDGVAEYAYFFKSMHDAMRIHERIYDLVRRNEQGKEKKVTIVIGGGGPTGVELAGELVGFCRHACRAWALQPTDFSITLIDAHRILAALDPKLSRWAYTRLQRLGVDIHLDTCVQKVRRGSVVIAPRPLREGEAHTALLCRMGKDEEQTLEADIFIWCGGVRAPEVVKQMPFLHDTKGRIDVEPTLQVKGEKRVYVVGDAAGLIDPKTNRVVPALAQTAIYQGKHAAQNIIRAISGSAGRPYPFPFLAYLVPLGGKYALAQFGRMKFRGHILYFLHRLIDLKYFISILPLGVALRTWLQGWKIYNRND